uniref:Variant surface glycoprotein n=1 Tax=Trypanosoma brucei TaxID=5691 RepID=A0A1V0FXV2_9TRYP|nr:variant surface glycoprotein [Trypanosoma brucei]
MHIITQSIAFTYVAVLMYSQQADASGAALKKAAWTEMCATAKELRAVPEAAAQKLRSQTAAIEVLETTALKIAAIAGAQHDSGDAIILAAIAAELRSEAQTQLENLKRLRQTALEATANSAAVYGGISEFLTLLTAAQTGTSNGCLAATDGSNVVSDKAGLGDCPIDKAISLTEASTTLTATFTEAGISTLQTADVKDSSSNNAVCVLFQNGGAAASKLFQKPATFLAAGGTLSVDTTATTLKTSHGAAIKTDSTPTGAALIKQAHTATRKLINQAAPPAAAVAKDKAKELAADSNFAAAVAKKMQLAGMPGTSSSATDYAKDKLKNLLDGGGSKFDSKWQALIDTKIHDGKSDKIKTEKASSISSTTELIQSVLYYQIELKTKFKRAKEELEQTKNDYEKKPQKPECNGKEEEECGTTKGCEWKNSTCKLTIAAQKAAEKAKQETEEAKKEEKCSDKKKEGDCTGNCKWDGKECKDSSILLNKQFALSVVSAAFAALLF